MDNIHFVNNTSGVVCEENGNEEFHVFHVEWERVEVPYAIGLWIILTAIIKVGGSSGEKGIQF